MKIRKILGKFEKQAIDLYVLNRPYNEEHFIQAQKEIYEAVRKMLPKDWKPNKDYDPKDRVECWMAQGREDYKKDTQENLKRLFKIVKKQK